MSVDLHTHSNKSDGSMSPTELIQEAYNKGLSAIALTDHDTTEGLDEAIQKGNELGIEVIPGVELSCEYQGKDVHIVGLYIDHHNKEFVAKLQQFVDSRELRNKKMCEKLTQAGLPVDYDELINMFSESVITRAHYARYMLSKGYIKSLPEAFDRYIGDYSPCFIPREKVTPVQGIELILSAGGIPVLAHPLLYKMGKDRLDNLVLELKEAGLVALEAVYCTYTPSDEREMRKLADQHNLLISGGSDFHGAAKPGLELGIGYGKLHVDDSVLTDLKKYNSDIKILFTDMDGTLLRDDKTISEQTRNAIYKMTQLGHKFVLSSGRALPNIIKTQKDIGLDIPGVYISASNGTLIYECDSQKVIFESRLTMEDLKNIWPMAHERGIHIQTYSDTELLVEKSDRESDFYMVNCPLPLIETIAPWEILTKPPVKMLCINLDDHEKLAKFGVDVAKKYPHLTTCFSSNTYLEIFSNKAGKGNSLVWLCNYLNIPVQNSFAAGDAYNDVSMIKAAGTGIAMCNGDPEIFEFADKISEFDNNSEGLSQYIVNEII